MLCSSRLHHALPPFRPPDGVRRCFLERSTSGPPPPATSPPESSHPWWCRRSCLLLAAGSGRGCPFTARAIVTPCAGPPHPQPLPRCRPHWGLYMASYVAGVAAPFLDVLTPVRAGARTFSHAEAAVAHPCKGGCRRQCDYQCHLPSSLQLFGFNSLVVAPRRRMGARTYSQ
jgi:hypothetical protein